MTIICGIDPGLSGAIALFDTETDSLEVIDMPVVEVLRGKSKKREVSPAMVADALAGRRIKHVFLERVGAMPGQGVTSMFSLGRTVGVLEGVVAMLSVPITIVPPQTWQKAMAVRGGKDGARMRAMELYPSYSDLFKRVKDDGRADAALIVGYGILFAK